jgi:hypothetical protein
MSCGILLLSSLLGSSAAPAAEDNLVARWRAEYPVASARWARALHAYEAEGVHTILFFDGTRSTTPVYSLARTGGSFTSLSNGRVREGRGGRETLHPSVACYTPEHVFDLARTAAEGPYLIERFGPSTPPDADDLKNTHLVTIGLVDSIAATPLGVRFESPAFSLVGTEALQEGGGPLLSLRYAWDGPDGREEGTIVLDPEHDWGLRRYDMTRARAPDPDVKPTDRSVPRPMRHEGRVDYRRLPDGTPFPSLTVSRVILASGAVQEERFEIRSASVGPPPPGRFRLSGYGLLDIPLRPRAAASAFSWANPWLWGSLAVAAACFGLLRATRPRRRAA